MKAIPPMNAPNIAQEKRGGVNLQSTLIMNVRFQANYDISIMRSYLIIVKVI